MEPESSTMAYPSADTLDQGMLKFALLLIFSLLIFCKYIVKSRWRFVVVTLDVLKRWDDKLFNFFRGNRNERSLEGDAEQGDDGRAAVVGESEEQGSHGRGFAQLFLFLIGLPMFGYWLYFRPGTLGGRTIVWLGAIGCTITLWPLLNCALDCIAWICRRMLRRFCKKSDEYMY